MKGSDRGQFGPDDAGSPGGASTLDAYLDGQLGPAERSAFEVRLSRDPALAGARDAQRRIDGSLRGLFVVPPFIPLPINGNPPGGSNGHPANGHPVSPATPAAGGNGGGGWAAIKSAILSTKGLIVGLALLVGMLGVGGWWYFQPAPPPRPLSFSEAYHKQVHTPASCGPVEVAQVESVASTTLGYPIRLKHRPANVELVSMSSAHVMSPHTFVLQARYEGQDVVLLADRACEDAPSASSGCSMQQFRREVGGVVFYELSPLAEPMLLNSFEVFEAGTTPPFTSASATRGAATTPTHHKP